MVKSKPVPMKRLKVVRDLWAGKLGHHAENGRIIEFADYHEARNYAAENHYCGIAVEFGKLP